MVEVVVRPVVHGNALSLEEWSHWFTPSHVLGMWDTKLRRDTDEGETIVQEIVDAVRPEPVETVSGTEEEADTLGQLTLF